MSNGLKRGVRYRIPSTSVSYDSTVSRRVVEWTGETLDLPMGGGRMAEFREVKGRAAYPALEGTVWLRPWGVVLDD